VSRLEPPRRAPGASMNMAQTPNRRVCQKRTLALSERVTDVPAAVPQTVRKSFDRLRSVLQQALLCYDFLHRATARPGPRCGQVLRNCSSHPRLYGGAAQYSRW
jgi:transcriptional regulator of met regulon